MKSSFDYQQYLALIREDVKEKDEDLFLDEKEIIRDYDKKISGTIDLTNIENKDIEKYIFNYNGFIIGRFYLKVIKHLCYPNYQNKSDLKVNLIIYETINECVKKKVKVLTDLRFKDKSWNNNFSRLDTGVGINIIDLIDIIKWLKGLHKFAAFI